MTLEELAQIQTIIQAAVAPLATKEEIQSTRQEIQTLRTEMKQEIQALETKISAVETRVEKSEQKIITKLDQLEKLSADYLDGRIQTVTRRVDRIEKHLNLTP